MKLEKFKKIIDEVKEYCIEIHLYNWGEPTLNKHLVEIRKSKENLHLLVAKTNID